MRPILLTQPLPSRFRSAARVLLQCRRFSADALLIAAEAFDDASELARLDHALVAADQASELAELLRAAAPGRARYAAKPFGHVVSPELAVQLRDDAA